MFDPQAWKSLVNGASCPMCSAGQIDPAQSIVARLASGAVSLQNDGALRGYCILIYKRHVTEIFDLTEAERVQLIHDIDHVARAIRDVCEPTKINYAILGNEVPHLHVHVIPRYPDDGYWGKAIWLRPKHEIRQLSESEFESLRSGLALRMKGDASKPTAAGA